VIVVQRSVAAAELVAFDATGAQLRSAVVGGPVSVVDKYYYTDTSEFLIVGRSGTAILVYDVSTLALIATLPVAFTNFCAIKGACAVLVETGGNLESHEFDQPLAMLNQRIAP
jgi:hypothetical protein